MSSRSIRAPQRRSDVLARGGPDDLARDRASRDRLLATARELVAATAHHPDAGCAAAGCPDRRRCALAHRLAGVDADPTADERRGGVEVHAAILRFDDALTGAIDAVRRCRQTEHRRTGRCWFAAVPDVDGCGEILRAVHRLG